MFDVGFWEILLIGVLALIVIGPERLPGAARQAGYFVGKARRYIEGVKNEVASELDVSEFKRMLHNQEVQINELQSQLKSGIDDVVKDVSTTTDLDADVGEITSEQLVEVSAEQSTERSTEQSIESVESSLSPKKEGH